jgi:hypothetical protein
LIEGLALADDRAFGKQPARDDTGNLRADFGDLEGGDTAGKRLFDRGARRLDHDIADLDRSVWPARPALTFAGRAAPAGCRQQE